MNFDFLKKSDQDINKICVTFVTVENKHFIVLWWTRYTVEMMFVNYSKIISLFGKLVTICDELILYH